MCCSDRNFVKGGMVTVINNMLECKNWEEFELIYIPTHIETYHIKKLLFFLIAYSRILYYFITKKIDLVHLHVSERGSFYRKAFILKTAKRFRIPVILHHHGAEFEDFYQDSSKARKRYIKKILEQADQNIVLSLESANKLIYKAPKAKTNIIHNAVTVPEKNEYGQQCFLILTLGRLGKRKGTEDLIYAFDSIKNRIPESIKLCLCGDGALNETKDLIHRLKLEDRVMHIGWVNLEQKNKFMESTVCHVLPSYREVLPMSILETMSHGIPNISTGIASIPEVIEDGKQGFLIEPGDRKILADRLEILCKNQKLCQRMSEQSYKKIKEEFSMEAYCEKVKRTYREVLYPNAGRYKGKAEGETAKNT